MNKRFSAMLAATVVATTVAGCTSAAQTDAQGGSAGTVTLAYQNQISTLDPIRADYAQTNFVDQAAYDTLVTYNSKNEVVPSLASDFSVSPDTRSISLTLRDATFHNGAPVTAKDVVFTLDRVRDLGTGVAGQITGYQRSEALDDRHVRIDLSAPNSLFLGALSKIWIVNSALVEANKGTDNGQGYLATHDAGSGPFQLADTSQADVLSLKRFDKYWDFDAKRPASIVYRRIDESETQAAQLRSGGIDVSFGLSASDAKSLKGASGVTVDNTPVPLQANIFFNTSQGSTANPAVREAVRYAYDYSGGLASIRGGLGSIASGPLPNTFACRPDMPAFSQDLAKARQTLEAAGIHDLHLTMRYQPVFNEQAREATLLQSDLAQIGVKLDLVPIAYADYLTSLKSWQSIPEMMLATDFPQYPDPGVMLVKTYESDQVGTNKGAYSNPAVDKLLKQAVVTSDDTQRCDLYKQTQQIIRDDAVAVNMYTLDQSVAYSQRVRDVEPASVGNGIWVPALRVG